MSFKKSIAGIVLGVSLIASAAFAVDYSKMSTVELSEMRGTMQNVTVEGRNAFRQEWQNRIQAMTQEEKQKYLGKPENAGQGMMKQDRDSMQNGGGMGGGGRR